VRVNASERTVFLVVVILHTPIRDRRARLRTETPL